MRRQKAQMHLKGQQNKRSGKITNVSQTFREIAENTSLTFQSFLKSGSRVRLEFSIQFEAVVAAKLLHDF